MLGSALGTAIRKRDKEAFDALAGMGKLSDLLDDSAAANTAAVAAAGTPATPSAANSATGGTADASVAAAPAGPGLHPDAPATDADAGGAAADVLQDATVLGESAGAALSSASVAAPGSTSGKGGYIISFKKDQVSGGKC